MYLSLPTDWPPALGPEDKYLREIGELVWAFEVHIREQIDYVQSEIDDGENSPPNNSSHPWLDWLEHLATSAAEMHATLRKLRDINALPARRVHELAKIKARVAAAAQ